MENILFILTIYIITNTWYICHNGDAAATQVSTCPILVRLPDTAEGSSIQCGQTRKEIHA